MKYAVVTYIFGKRKELLREPAFRDRDVEYICVTDQTDLRSGVWKVVIDNIPQANCVRDKMVYVKYNPFKYTDADIICVIDGSLKIAHSLMPLFKQAENNDILIKKHPDRDNLTVELDKWIKTRGMPASAKEKFNIMGKTANIDLNNKFLIESCVLVYNKSDRVKKLCETEISHMEFLGQDGKLFLSNQCVLTFLLQQVDIKYDYLNQKDFFIRYRHNTTSVVNK